MTAWEERQVVQTKWFLLFLHLGHVKDVDHLGYIRVETEHVLLPRSQAILMAMIPLSEL